MEAASPEPASLTTDEPGFETPAGTEHHRTPATKSIDGTAEADTSTVAESLAGFNTVADADAAKLAEISELLMKERADALPGGRSLVKLTPAIQMLAGAPAAAQASAHAAARRT